MRQRSHSLRLVCSACNAIEAWGGVQVVALAPAPMCLRAVEVNSVAARPSKHPSHHLLPGRAVNVRLALVPPLQIQVGSGGRAPDAITVGVQREGGKPGVRQRVNTCKRSAGALTAQLQSESKHK